MQNTQPKINLLTIGEASEYLGISIDTLRRWERKNRIEPLRSPGGHRYYNKEDLDNLFGKKYVREEPTIRKSANETEDSLQEENLSATTSQPKEEVPPKPVIGLPAWRAIKNDGLSELPDLTDSPESLTNHQPLILDRPAREVRIPENSRIRIIREDAVLTPQEAYYRQQSVSVLTPPIPIQNSFTLSPATPLGINSAEGPISQNISINKKTLIYAGVFLGVVFLLITWYFLWQSSQKVLPQLP